MREKRSVLLRTKQRSYDRIKLDNVGLETVTNGEKQEPSLVSAGARADSAPVICQLVTLFLIP